MAYTHITESTLYYLIKEVEGEYEVVKMSDTVNNDIFLDAQDYLAQGMGLMQVKEEMETAFLADYVDIPGYDGRVDGMASILLEYLLQGKPGPSYYFVGLQFRNNNEKFRFVDNYDKYKTYFVKWFERLGFLDPTAKNCFNALRVLEKLRQIMPGINIKKLADDDNLGSEEYLAFINAYTYILLEAEDNIVVLRQ